MRQTIWRGAALALTPVLAAGAADAPSTRQESAQQAAEYAAQYGGAVSIQYALWEDGEITLTGHSGVYSKTENRALTEDVLYGVGSVSKVYTTAAVMKLVEAGEVDLDRPVTAYLPDFKMADERYRDITVRMLLNHSSGLMGSTMGSAFLLDDPADRSAADELLERLSVQTLKADPGAYSVYCNDGFTLAQLVVEAVSGQSLEGYLRAEFFTPMGLEDTFAPADDFERDRLAKTYLGEDTRALPPESLGVLGTGGVYATASDLAAFGGLFCGGGPLSGDSLEAMAAPEYAGGLWPEDADDMVAYGLGWDSVAFPPFAYSGIQALAKGGDTQLYHAGLVVLPEYGMSCAVLSSGGVSTFNEMAASRILLDALKERGVEVDEAPRTLEEVQPAGMPAELADCSGLYGSNAQMARVEIGVDGTMRISYLSVPGGLVQNFTYRSDGTFRNEDNTAAVRPVEENGRVYLWQKGYGVLPGLGQEAVSNYYLQKLPESALTPEEQAQWDRRADRLYLMLNEKYTSQVYAQILPGAGLPLSGDCPGYLLNGMRMTDGDTAVNEAQIPGTAGRDGADMKFHQENGLEYMTIRGGIFVETAAAQPLWGGAGAYSTIQPDGYARWYTVGDLAGKTMAVALPERGAFAVYDAGGATVAASWAFGDATAVLPEGGWIVFAGDPGVRFYLEMTE